MSTIWVATVSAEVKEAREAAILRASIIRMMRSL